MDAGGIVNAAVHTCALVETVISTGAWTTGPERSTISIICVESINMLFSHQSKTVQVLNILYDPEQIGTITSS
jgi:hypothetical protein